MNDIILDEKRAARQELNDAIKALSVEYLSESDKGIRENLLAMPEFARADVILFYFSIGREPDTHELIHSAFGMGKTVALPVTMPDGSMTARIVNDVTSLSIRNLGIPEPDDTRPPLLPEEIDLIVVPAVAFDRRGYRLGRGGGFYDRYLARTSGCSVGLAREGLLRDCVPVEPHDMAVDCVVTERGVLRLK
ncbi:MAG: 5-formyltetrahydrofolate cyclo-ligase [Oscillospiraceae bacterium]|nr:5-formyltetrahydrofolate cyclo-ligase [Oscillospiraceae bacterium]